MNGNQAKVLVCVPAPEVLSNELCGAGFSVQIKDAFLLDSVESTQIDPAVAAASFSASFLLILSLFIGSRVIGKIVSMVR